MASVIVNAAIAIYENLSATYTPEYSGYVVSREYYPQYELDKSAPAKIIVVPMERALSHESRKANHQDIRIDIAVMKKLSGSVTDELEQIDESLQTVDELIVALDKYPFEADGVRFLVTGIKNSPIAADEHYKAFGQFTSLIQLTITCFT